MESKLKAYRRKKAREELLDRTQNKIKSIFHKMFNSDTKDEKVPEDDTRLEISKEVIDESTDVASDIESTCENESMDEDGELFDARTWTKLTLYTSLWAFLFVLAIHAEFGAVYFVISLMVILWKNTRTGPKKAGELSAYSVFNPNCEAIEGTLDAEQLQKELLYGFR